MEIKWTDDGDGTLSARVGSVILLVTPRDGGVWTAQIKIKYGIADDATFACREDAVRWCGRRLPEIVDPIVATARAEAALAEREACVAVARDLVDSDVSGYLSLGARAALSSIRARTTPATLSTETLAAIAEARGLRVVMPELLAGIDATALATAERERDEARAELAQERADLAALTARVETEIAAAAEAVRARTIAECVAYAVATEAGLMARGEVGEMHYGAHDVVLALRALAALAALSAPQPAPAEPADVDPAAGALR